jgi:integrase/recombinase XerC
MVKAWMYELSHDKISARSINRKLSSLNHFYKFLQRQETVKKNPLSSIKGLKTEKRLHKWLRQEEIMDLLGEAPLEQEYSKVRDRVILEILYGCGLRLSELTGLTHEGLNMRAGTLKVLGKRNKERIIPIPVNTLKRIDLYLLLKKSEALPLTGPLLLTDAGKPLYPVYVWRLVKSETAKVSSQTGISPHVLRHSYATHILNNGGELSAIKELLGHSSLAATQIYTHTTIEQLKEIYKKAHPRGEAS